MPPNRGGLPCATLFVSPIFGITTGAPETLSFDGVAFGGPSPFVVELGETVKSLDDDDDETRLWPRVFSFSLTSTPPRPFDLCLGAFKSSNAPSPAGTDSGLVAAVEPEAFEDDDTSSEMFPRGYWPINTEKKQTKHSVLYQKCFFTRRRIPLLQYSINNMPRQHGILEHRLAF